MWYSKRLEERYLPKEPDDGDPDYITVESSFDDVECFNKSLLFFGISPIKLDQYGEKRERYGKRKLASIKERLCSSFSTFLSDEIDFSDSCKNWENYLELISSIKQKLQVCNQGEKIQLLTLTPPYWSKRKAAK